ncbi:NnrS family protein [Oceanospirillum linum]|uniref:NnrS family protein n=1 Tax=Oceanospirillum linum TaxID=966 RepID=A0A1T1HD61_OCELI|nr:NnrS family protein [Oceanospirillum linum]OOV87742.1 hypothetical protein BTA35_0206960 [Oceanospirillum linum]SEG13740.1 uncharacterized protein involved in response to NO [Oleiphilus messinensis]SMP10445.1 uncharacterized protein involved in response to NO [Oceanospirillum linum]
MAASQLSYRSDLKFSSGALFSLGFRPFFLLGALFAVVLMLGWVFQLRGVALPFAAGDNYYPGVLWHSHELIFGFATAIISGFLLTAVGNWTGQKMLHGRGLAALVLLWTAGRIAPFLPLEPLFVALIDLAFYPLLTLAIALPILKSGNMRNLVFIIFCGLLILMNLLVHLDRLDIAPGMAHLGIYGALNIIVLVMLIIGGRVIPFFTERATPEYRGQQIAWVEKLVIPVAVITFLNDLWQPLASWAYILSGLLGLLLLLRVGGWFDRRVLSNPLLWILHGGYLMIGLGFMLRATLPWTGWSPFIYIHALTLGGIGLLTLGMMSRVSLGHTGRPLILPVQMHVAFYCLLLAVIARVFAMAILQKPFLYDLSATGWILAFGLFVYTYLPALVSPRADGKS